jgi:hypothetical protein
MRKTFRTWLVKIASDAVDKLVGYGVNWCKQRGGMALSREMTFNKHCGK